MKYLVEVREQITYLLEIEAESVEEAREAARVQVNKQRVVTAEIIDVPAGEVTP